MSSDTRSSLHSPLYRVIVTAIGLRVTRFLLRTAGFQRTIVWLAAIPQQFASVEDSDPLWATEIDYVSGWRYGASCLDRSVYLWFLLHQHGIEADLRIGISMADDTIDGHAWVEHQDTVLNDRDDIAAGFAVFDGDPIGLVFR